jgi:hypothetical protein
VLPAPLAAAAADPAVLAAVLAAADPAVLAAALAAVGAAALAPAAADPTATLAPLAGAASAAALAARVRRQELVAAALRRPLVPRVHEATPHDPSWLSSAGALAYKPAPERTVALVADEHGPQVPTRAPLVAVEKLPRDTFRVALAELGPLAASAASAARPLADEVCTAHALKGSSFVLVFESAGGSPTDAHIRTVKLRKDVDGAFWVLARNFSAPLGGEYASVNGGASRGLYSKGSDYCAKHGKAEIWS